MATMQDFLELDGVRLERNTLIVSTQDGDMIVADVHTGATGEELHYTAYGVTLAAELDGSPSQAAVRRKKKIEPFVELPQTPGDQPG